MKNKKKNRGKYRVKRVCRISKEESAKLIWEVLVKEVKSIVGIK
jgi:hypothetical protein